jgi:hypothetical protein
MLTWAIGSKLMPVIFTEVSTFEIEIITTPCPCHELEMSEVIWISD